MKLNLTMLLALLAAVSMTAVHANLLEALGVQNCPNKVRIYADAKIMFF